MATKENEANGTLLRKLLGIHKTLAGEMRHTATVVWQFLGRHSPLYRVAQQSQVARTALKASLVSLHRGRFSRVAVIQHHVSYDRRMNEKDSERHLGCRATASEVGT